MQPLRIVAVVVVVALFPSVSPGSDASINGQVVDSQQARIPTSTVSLTNVDTKVAVQSTSDSTGNFILPPVDPGVSRPSGESARIRRHIIDWHYARDGRIEGGEDCPASRSRAIGRGEHNASGADNRRWTAA